MPAARSNTPVPVTILTGFLGSGKTSLLQHILTEQHGEKIAVIENEFGEVAIDHEILVSSKDQQIIVMSNGCLCCTVRGDLSQHLLTLDQKRASGELDFSRVVIETTGLAKPAPVAQTFFIDAAVRSRYRLDGIVTLVDAKHADRQLDQHAEAQEQVAFADRLLLSKTDLISAPEEARLRRRLAGINPRASLDRVDRGRISLDKVLGINGFDLNAVLEVLPDFVADANVESAHVCDSRCEHSGTSVPALTALHLHDIQSFVLRSQNPLNPERFEVFLRAMIDLYSAELMRYKGIVNLHNASERFIFQGVHMVMGASPGARWREGEPRETKLVFIGRNLPRALFEHEFRRCIVNSAY